MAIPKQLVIGIIIGLLIGASSVYIFTQYTSPTKDSQISNLQNKVASLENFILINSQKSTALPIVSSSADPVKRAAIQNVSVIEEGVLVWAQATSGQDVTIATAWIKDTNGTIVTKGDLDSTVLPMDGTLTSITVLFPKIGVLSSGGDYTVTLVSVYGDSLVSPTFTLAAT